MKYRILYLFVMLIGFLSVFAQGVTDNIYIYRNDGQFNAFHSKEVDSLKYSKTDLNGVEHFDFVVQEIWTPDSVYRIPLSAIDSISVATPEIKYAPKVKNLLADYKSYIKKVDGMNISFSNELPHALRISKGDILLYEGFDTLFPDGFAGRVTSLVSNANSIDVGCETVELSDIYEQYISVGYYEMEEDPTRQGGYRLAPSTRATDLVSIKFESEVDLGGGATCKLTGETAIRVKVVANINTSHTFIELMFTPHTTLEGWISFEKKAEKEVSKTITEISFPLPNLPMLKLKSGINLFGNASLTGSADIKSELTTEQTVSVIYEDGKFKLNNSGRHNESNLSGSVAVQGELFCGLRFVPGLTTVGNIVSFDVPIDIGPHFEFDIRGDLAEEPLYDRVKGSNYSISTRIGAKVEFKDKISKETVTLGQGFYYDILKSTFNLLPEFKDIEIESDTKSITVNSTAFQDLLIPCEVGFRILDEKGETVDSYYSNEKKKISTPELKYGHTFTKNLKSGQKYLIRPLVRLWNIELVASPEKECYLDCDISTGRSLAGLNSFEMSGSVKSEVPSNVEVGFVYTSEKVNPTIENATSFTGTFTDTKEFKGSKSGLREGTTYYYRAYIHYNDFYYYGDTQCVTTKRSIDIVNDDNPGGGSNSASKAYVSTGQSADIDMREAKIGLTFNTISPSTECGYYLQAESKKGKTLSAVYRSLGTVTGNQTVELTSLLPDTKYTYWAIAKNSAGTSTGQKRTFKTEPSPDPVSKILDMTDIDLQSATINCYFDNYQDTKECGIRYEAGEFSYKETCQPKSDGTAEIKLDKLTAETEYIITPYVEVYEEDEVFNGEPENLVTLGPDITGWWIFNDGQGDDGGRVHDVEIRSNGRTNNFFGIHFLNWEREGRNITMRFGTLDDGGTTNWVYRGTFNEDFTYASGKAAFEWDFGDQHEDLIVSTFYLKRK